eukprot:1578190-Amphidinium_carterae.1
MQSARLVQGAALRARRVCQEPPQRCDGSHTTEGSIQQSLSMLAIHLPHTEASIQQPLQVEVARTCICCIPTLKLGPTLRSAPLQVQHVEVE